MGPRTKAITGVASIKGVHAMLQIRPSPGKEMKGVGDYAGVQDRIR